MLLLPADLALKGQGPFSGHPVCKNMLILFCIEFLSSFFLVSHSYLFLRCTQVLFLPLCWYLPRVQPFQSPCISKCIPFSNVNKPQAQCGDEPSPRGVAACRTPSPPGPGTGPSRPWRRWESRVSLARTSRAPQPIWCRGYSVMEYPQYYQLFLLFSLSHEW